jgi:predicted metal-dependent hydrolase
LTSKTFNIPELGTIIVTKKPRNRNLRISFAGDGQIRVSVPRLSTWGEAIGFVIAKKSWIDQHRPIKKIFKSNQVVANNFILSLSPDAVAARCSSQLKNGVLLVSYPGELPSADPIVQNYVRKKVLRLISDQAELWLPSRLSQLASQFAFNYLSVTIKFTRTRWGSCDQFGNIKLNPALIYLEPKLVDCVLLHELCHTKHHDHGADFWAEMSRIIPDIKARRSALRKHRPDIH